MGYMGLDHFNDSDSSSDFVYVVTNKIGELCEKELKDKGNPYNTSGDVNVALFAEAFLMTVKLDDESSLHKAMVSCRDSLQKRLNGIEKGEDWDDKKMHVSAFKRMIRNLNTIITNAY